MKTNSYIIGVIAAILAMIFWSSSFVALKIALKDMNAFTIIFLRMLFGSVFFIIFFSKHIKVKIELKDLKYIIMMVFFEPFLYFIFEINALKYTSASQAGVITATMPLLTAFAAALFLKEKLTKFLILGSIIAFSGAVWLSLKASAYENAINPLLGNTLELIAMICGAGYAVSIKHLIKKFSPYFLTMAQSIGGALLFLPLALIESVSLGVNFSTQSFIAVLYLGICVTILGYGAFNYSLTKLDASVASSFVNLIPALSLILGFLILDDKLNNSQWIATIFIFIGVYISTKKEKYEK